MTFRLEIKRKLTARSDRVKSVDLHPTEPWLLSALYNGNVYIWNHENQQLVKTFEICELPVRCAKFISRKNWIVTGSDDMQIRIINYNTKDKVHSYDAHSDYIRCIVVHPVQPIVLSSSDDLSIKLWNWEKQWSCLQVFDGHTHYVMQIVFNPKDNNTFATASLDRTLKVWNLGSSVANFTLEGHEKGVNCVDYYHGSDKPYLISGADDHLVKIWDYQNKTCVQTLEVHVNNVTTVCFHPELPIALSGSEDGTVRIWHSGTYRLESTLNYGYERVWTTCSLHGSNNIAIGYDEGTVMIKIGTEEPAISMDVNGGKIICAKHCEIQQINLKAIPEGTEIKDGEKLQVTVKDLGSCEIYPQKIMHNPNGRFVVVCGNGEYIIYTAMALRNKSFGSAHEFVWAQDSSEYAIRNGNTCVKIYKNFKEKHTLKTDCGVEGIFGGFMLGVKSLIGLSLYDWDNFTLIRRIDIQPIAIYWSESGHLLCLATEDKYFILKCNLDEINSGESGEDGIESAFDVLQETNEVVRTGLWVGDCFIYTNNANRLNYYVGGEIVVISHLYRPMYLLGYVMNDNKIYLGDKDLNIVSYSLLLSVLRYQTAVMRRDRETADKIISTIPHEHKMRVAQFLEKQGFKLEAMHLSTDPEHKFELAIQLKDLNIAEQLSQEANSHTKWKQLADLAISLHKFQLAEQCLEKANDFNGLLLLATCSGNAEMARNLAKRTEDEGQHNIAFLTNFILGNLDRCLDMLINSNRLPEAAFFSRSYLPSKVSDVVELWKTHLATINEKVSKSIADPKNYSNLFPDIEKALKAELSFSHERGTLLKAAQAATTKPNLERLLVNEIGQENVTVTNGGSLNDENQTNDDLLRSTTPDEFITDETVFKSSNTDTDAIPQKQFGTENRIEVDDEDDDITTLLNDIDLSNMKSEIDYSDIDDDLDY